MIDDKELEWEELECEHIVQDEWIDFCRVRYRFPDGNEFSPYYRYSRRSYVVIVAKREDGKYICVRQYRQGIRKVTVEFPAGGIETGGATQYEKNGGDVSYTRDADTSALEAAKRELQEETGYQSDDWSHLITVPSNATVADNYAHIFYAKNCRKVSGLQLDDTEFLEPEVYSREEIQALIDNGTFAQAIHVMALLLAEKEQ